MQQAQDQRQQNGAEGVNVTDRIEAEAAFIGGGGVAKVAGDISVCGFVQGNCKRTGMAKTVMV
jgi:hypothetical protein